MTSIKHLLHLTCIYFFEKPYFFVDQTFQTFCIQGEKQTVNPASIFIMHKVPTLMQFSSQRLNFFCTKYVQGRTIKSKGEWWEFFLSNFFPLVISWTIQFGSSTNSQAVSQIWEWSVAKAFKGCMASDVHPEHRFWQDRETANIMTRKLSW